MRGDKKGFGKVLYAEWIYPIKDYCVSTKKNEMFFEIVLPIIISVIVTIVCVVNKNVSIAIDRLADILMTLTSILIGFSIMLVTLLLTSGGDGVDRLKEKTIDKKLYAKPINLFQKLHIQFVCTLISEIILLISVMLYYFISSFADDGVWQIVGLIGFVFMILNILLSILRGITNVYFSYYYK